MRHSVLFATAFATLISTQTFAADLPGKGITVNPVQSTITEETFQTLLVSRALEKLGYTVNKPSEVDYNVGYTIYTLFIGGSHRHESYRKYVYGQINTC